MIALIIVVYFLASAATTGVLLGSGEFDIDEDGLAAGAFSLVWPIILVIWVLYRTGKVAHDLALASKQRKELPEARTVARD